MEIQAFHVVPMVHTSCICSQCGRRDGVVYLSVPAYSLVALCVGCVRQWMMAWVSFLPSEQTMPRTTGGGARMRLGQHA